MAATLLNYQWIKERKKEYASEIQITLAED